MLTYYRLRGKQGSYDIVQIQRPVDGGHEAAEGDFTEDVTLQADVWPGQGRAVCASLPVTWEDAQAGEVRLEFPPDQMELEPGSYGGMIYANGAAVVEFMLVIEDTPQDEIAGPVYATYRDLLRELPWIKDNTSINSDQSKFALVLTQAREWLDDVILANYQPFMYGSRLKSEHTFGFISGPISKKWLIDALANDQLMLDTPNGRKLKRACTYYALSQILHRFVGENSTNFVNLASYYKHEAESLVQTADVELDSDEDGIANTTFTLRTTGRF